MERIDKNLLTVQDLDYLDSNAQLIQDNWEKNQRFRTETEMRISVLNDVKFPTPASKYWQSVREMSVFYQNLVTLSFEYRRNQIEQQLLERDIAAAEDTLESGLLQIDLEEKQFIQINMEQTAKARMREIRLWLKIMEEQVQADDFDTENVDTHQLLSYAHRFTRQAQNIGNASPSEMANLMGQYHTTMRLLKEKGLLPPEKLHAIR